MDAGELESRTAIGGRIKAERTRVGLLHEQFAEKVGCSRATVFNWESGMRMPDALALLAMQQTMGLDVQFIVTGERMAISKLTLTQEDVAKKLGDMPERLQQLVADVTHVTWLAFDSRRTYDYGSALSSGQAPAPMQVHDTTPTYARKTR